jgi:hypothetical protein
MVAWKRSSSVPSCDTHKTCAANPIDSALSETVRQFSVTTEQGGSLPKPKESKNDEDDDDCSDDPYDVVHDVLLGPQMGRGQYGGSPAKSLRI